MPIASTQVVERLSVGATSEPSQALKRRTETMTAATPDVAAPGQRLVLAASTLIGDEVTNPQGEDLGHIRELMIDARTGRVAYAVLSFGGILGMGDKLFAVPWPFLRLNQQDKTFVLDVSRQRLEEAPGFDKDHWPDMADIGWADAIERYYGAAAQRYDG
jgi:hypothetical protein